MSDMKKASKLVLAAATTVLLLGACSDFLKGPGLSTNPNKPTSASGQQLWVGAQVAFMGQWENYPFMLFTMWAGGISGVNRQWQTYAQYNSGTDLNAADGAWNQTFGPGGLRDLRVVEDSATSQANLMWRGEARVVEALYMGTAADIWGDVPYTNAGFVGLNPQPTFDTQANVYTHVLALLDSAIVDLGNPMPADATQTDFFFNNDATKWIKTAHTLKARFYMHTARTSATVYSAAALTNIITETALGISDSLSDFKPSHTTIPGEQNLFYSFQFSRAQDVDPAKTHIDETKAEKEDTLLRNWYIPNGKNYYGSPAGVAGASIDSIGTFSVVQHPDAEWGIVTFAENQMLMAEAQYRQGNTAGALATLNAYRATLGNGILAVAPVPVGVNILGAVLREKMVHQFFNPEIWNDYLRTCYPNIPLPAAYNASIPYVPARLPVGYTEQTTNPNVPPQPDGNPGNANDFKNLTAIDGVTTCLGQVQRP
jgi:hypothetical protein